MPFVISKVLDHGTSNPIVARLSLQTMQLLNQCKIAKETRDKIAELYLQSLQKKLIRCWEIKERFRSEFNSAAASYKPPSSGSQYVEVPQVARLEEECHNFLYEAKNYVRDLLNVFNILYGTDFKEASEFFRPKKGSKSAVEFAAATFGPDDPKTKFLQEAIEQVEHIVNFRNAVEHPGGFSGELRITNFALEPDGKVCEPTWFLEKDGARVNDPSSIRTDMETSLHNLLQLAEDVVASWAADNLSAGVMAQVAVVPEERRDPKCPIKYVVTVSAELEQLFSKHLQKADNNSRDERHHPVQTSDDVIAEKKNLLGCLPKLTLEDREAIAAALGTGPDGYLSEYNYYRDAARDFPGRWPHRIGLLDREFVIERLRKKYPFWPQARETLRKLQCVRSG